jgi:radical SAM superfamily enzyme YgiQ (UPF0313 family)
MKVTLIKPSLGRLAAGPHHERGRMEPLGLGVLAGLTPPGVDLELFDDRFNEIDYDEPTDLVAITVETFTARRSYEISAEYRSRGVPVVMGGMHATLVPEEVADHADAVCLGDAESTWRHVLTDVRVGELRPRYVGTTDRPQSGATTNRAIYGRRRYLPLSLIQFGRGCRFRCEFCAVGAYFDHRQYTRAVADIVAELSQQARRNVFFVDDNILSDFGAAKELFRALVPLKLRWVSQASLDQTDDPELMELMVASGCLGNVIGFESLDPRNLAAMGKAPNVTAAYARYEDQVETLRHYGLQTWAAFVLGYDYDTRTSIEATLQWALDCKFTFGAFNVLMPYPGTALYRRFAAEDRLLYDGKWWLHPDYRFNHAAFKPRGMTADQLTELAWQCRSRFNSYGSIARRLLEPRTNLRNPTRFAVYCLYNPLYRREAFKKQDMLLGKR